MVKAKNYADPEDMFADTRMSFGEHIEELRKHLWRAIAGFLVGLVFSFFIGPYVLEFIKKPVEEELSRFYQARAHFRLDENGRGPTTTFMNHCRMRALGEFGNLNAVIIRNLTLAPPFPTAFSCITEVAGHATA